MNVVASAGVDWSGFRGGLSLLLFRILLGPLRSLGRL
jgi:hypothetical protein